MTKWSATARSLAASVSNERNPNPRLFFFSWSYIMTTSQTSPYFVKKFRKSVSVMVDGRPPKKTLGYPLLFLGFCMLLGLQALGSMVRPSRECGQLANTASILEGSAKVTKPKPLDRLVLLFFITTQSITSPKREKYERRDSWVVSQLQNWIISTSLWKWV